MQLQPFVTPMARGLGRFNMAVQDQISVLDAMVIRASSLKLRLLFACLVMISAGLVLEPFWLCVIWFGILVTVQSLDAFTTLRLAPNWAPKWRDRALLAICFMSNLSYCWLGTLLWSLGGTSGKIGSIAFMAAALLHIQNFSYRSAPVFWTSVAPYATVLSITTIFEIFAGSISHRELFAMTLLGVGFYTNLFLAYNHARSLTNNLYLQREAANAANNAKSEFLATMSHELRTPMNGILGGAELLKRSNPTPDQQDILDTVSGAGNSLLSLLNDILDLSKIEAGKMVIEAIAFAPRAVLVDVECLWSCEIADKGLTFNAEVSDQLPGAVVGDPTRLRQILINLVSNAIKFTNTGTIHVSMFVVNSVSGDSTIVVKVRDTGIGMNEEAVARLFQPFSQADSSISRRFGGSGLGTSISHRLAALLGGRLEVQSKVGEGTCFTLYLPLIEAKDYVVEDDSDEALDEAEGLTVLVAEDNAANRHILARFLEIGGHDVTFCEDGALAVEAASQQVFDLIILDVRMPVMDGLEALQTIRAKGGPNAGQPIIMLSADAMPAEKARGFEMGADDYLTKPIDPRLLFSALAMANGGRAAFGRVGRDANVRQSA
jgi:two-component system, sensor histidine kinase